MTPTFYREYRNLNRIAGMSLHKETLLYKVLPDPDEIPAPVNLKELQPKREITLRGFVAFACVVMGLSCVGFAIVGLVLSIAWWVR
jgi:hypothetical protein